MTCIWISLSLLVGCSNIIRQIQAERCSSNAAAQFPIKVTSRLGESLRLTGEVEGYPLTSKWSLTHVSHGNDTAASQELVSHSNRDITWFINSTNRPYTASFCQDDGGYSSTLVIKSLTCKDLGKYRCIFSGLAGDCGTQFIVTAEPLQPVIKPATVRGNVGDAVSIVCEASAGDTAGDITWYNIPADHYSKYRLLTPAPELSRDGDCVLARSTLTFQLKSMDHGGRIRCETAAGFAETFVKINGFPSIPNCPGGICYVSQAVSIRGTSLLLCLATLLLSLGWFVM